MKNSPRLSAVAVEMGFFRSGRHFRFRMKQFFGDHMLEDKIVLDIGGGAGLLSAFVASQGARDVHCLEPSAEGSRANTKAKFFRLIKLLELNNIAYIESSFQSLNADSCVYDIVIMHASLNHLNEKACESLHIDKYSQKQYLEIFARAHRILKPGGIVLIHDVSPVNAFRKLGLTHPFQRNIEWEKHQPPSQWMLLLKQAGFADIKVKWLSFDRLGYIGGIVLNNRVGSFLCSGRFDLYASKPNA